MSTLTWKKSQSGYNQEGDPVFLRDIWPTDQEIDEAMKQAVEPAMFKKRYAHILNDNPVWETIQVNTGAQYRWDPKSTYIQHPPYFEGFQPESSLLWKN